MKRALLLVMLFASTALAQPTDPYAPEQAPAPAAPPPVAPSDPATALREANAAATAGDWTKVSAYIEPLLAQSLDRTNLAEAHRLAGIAALFATPPRRDLAEHHFIEYLRIDLDGQLDPSLYPPEVITFFSDVRVKYAAELKARRPKKRYAVLTILPPFGQFQNGDKVKGIIIGSALGIFLATNLTTYFVLRSWCQRLQGPTGLTSAGCDETTDRYSSAKTLRALNITAGVGAILTYVYGVYDGVRGYGRSRREPTLAPYATSTNTSALLGVRLTF